MTTSTSTTFTHAIPWVEVLDWTPEDTDTTFAQHFLLGTWRALAAQHGQGLHNLEHNADFTFGAQNLQVIIRFDQPVLTPTISHTTLLEA